MKEAAHPNLSDLFILLVHAVGTTSQNPATISSDSTEHKTNDDE